MPAIIDLQAYPAKGQKEGWEDRDEEGHYAVVIGYTDDIILMSDPASVFDSYLSHEDFLRRWHDVGKHGDVEHRWAMVPCGIAPVYSSEVVKRML